MNPATLSLVISLVEQAPELWTELGNLLGRNNPPTTADFETLRTAVLNETYNQFVPQSAIPSGQ